MLFIVEPVLTYPSFVTQVSNSKIAEELLEEINAHIPTD